MVAGATGIDLFLLVIDAAEGARPQTLEHLAILRLLGIERGVVALTKADPSTPRRSSWRSPRRESSSPVRRRRGQRARPGPVSTSCGRRSRGQPTVSARAARRADAALRRPRRSRCAASAPSSRGRSGQARSARATSCGSSRRRDVRMRTVQVHDTPVDRAEAGQRVAVALPGRRAARASTRRRARRAGAFPIVPARHRARGARGRAGRACTVHHGTATCRRASARRRAAGRSSGSPSRSLRRAATASCCAADTRRRRRRPRPRASAARDAERLELVERGEIAATVHAPVRADRSATSSTASSRASSAPAAGVFSPAWLDELRAGSRRAIAAADPLDPGVPPAPSRGRPRSCRCSALERRGAMLYRARRGRRARRPRRGRRRRSRRSSGRAGQGRATPELARFLEEQGRLVRLGDGFAVVSRRLDRRARRVVAECEPAGRISLPRFRDLLGVGRQDAQLLLERLDADGVTRRIGDERVLRRRGTLSR